MTMRETPDDTDLDALFAEVRAADRRPPGALVARVLADAEAQRRGGGQERFGAALLRVLGGWPAAAGLGAASAAGLLIGFASPEAVPLADALSGGAFDLIDLAPGYGVFAAFGG
jgi:hypothetical protein